MLITLQEAVLLSIIVSFGFGNALLCYDCNSIYDPKCGGGEDFDPADLNVTNCALQEPPFWLQVSESTFCRTSTYEVYGMVRVVRSCGYLLEEEGKRDKCQPRRGIDDIFFTYCTCSEDLCNADPRNSETQLISNPLVVVLFLVPLVIN